MYMVRFYGYGNDTRIILVVGGRANAGHVRCRAAAASAWFVRAARATNIVGHLDTNDAIRTGINGSQRFQ